MDRNTNFTKEIKQALLRISTTEKAQSSKRYFPLGINCVGATAPDIKLIISEFQSKHSYLTAQQTLDITENLLKNAEYSEEKLVAFGLLNKFVKKHFDKTLLLRFQFWLENYADNWSHVDDLCIKTIYQFFIVRPELIPTTKHWKNSPSPWCRRAGNVVWVKFIKRKIGKSTYYLDKELVFKNCTTLLADEDEFVQKSIGWLLKATSLHNEDDVIKYIQKNITKIERSTLRYAIEKMQTPNKKNY